MGGGHRVGANTSLGKGEKQKDLLRGCGGIFKSMSQIWIPNFGYCLGYSPSFSKEFINASKGSCSGICECIVDFYFDFVLFVDSLIFGGLFFCTCSSKILLGAT